MAPIAVGGPMISTPEKHEIIRHVGIRYLMWSGRQPRLAKVSFRSMMTVLTLMLPSTSSAIEYEVMTCRAPAKENV